MEEIEINSERNMKKIEKKIKFYQTYLFKLVTSSITIFTLIISGLYYTNKYIVEKSIKESRKFITDSLQDLAIEQKGESIGACNMRIDFVQSKQNNQDLVINEAHTDIKFIRKVVIILAGKIDKTIIPLLEDRQSDKIKLDSLNNYQRKYAYNDSLSVDNMPRETIEVMYRSDKIREADYVEDLNGFNETLKACKPVNPLKYFIFIP